MTLKNTPSLTCHWRWLPPPQLIYHPIPKNIGYYLSKNTKENFAPLGWPSTPNFTWSRICNLGLSVETLVKYIKNLHEGVGHDGIHTSVLKNASELFLDNVVVFMNSCLRNLCRFLLVNVRKQSPQCSLTLWGTVGEGRAADTVIRAYKTPRVP